MSSIGISSHIEDIVDKHSLAKHEKDYVFEEDHFFKVNYDHHFYKIHWKNQRSWRRDW
jgi:hypothetical protein